MRLKTKSGETVDLEPESVKSREDYEKGDAIRRVMGSLGIVEHGTWKTCEPDRPRHRRFFVRGFSNGTSAIIEELEAEEEGKR